MEVWIPWAGAWPELLSSQWSAPSLGLSTLALMLDTMSLHCLLSFFHQKNPPKTLLCIFFSIPSLGFSLQYPANSGFGQKCLQSYSELKYQHVPSNSFHFPQGLSFAFLLPKKSTLLLDCAWLSAMFAPAERAPSTAVNFTLWMFFSLYFFKKAFNIYVYEYT